MLQPTIGLAQVKRFIKKELKEKLHSDLMRFKLIREADVECAAYMHLRLFLDSDEAWTVLARKYVPHTEYYIDLVLFHNKIPKIAIEIKWGMSSIQPKDRNSLGAAIKMLRVNSAYWLSVSMLGSPAAILKKEAHEKNCLHQISVRGDLNATEVAEWKKVREEFKSKMQIGRGRKHNERGAIEEED